MKHLVFACLVLFSTATVSLGGPNSGGAVLLHWSSTAIMYTGDPEYLDGGLTRCEDAVVQAPPATSIPNPPWPERQIWFAYAAFPDGSSPRLKAVALGVNYTAISGPSGIKIDWYATPAGTTEAPTTSPAWPLPNSGNALVFATTRTAQVDQLLVFAGYGTQGQIMSLRTHPSTPSSFADDAVPANLDPIVAFGSMGFGVDGQIRCPGSPDLGACCYPDCSCQVVQQSDCPTGDWRMGFQCDPNPCSCPQGACCRPDGTCQFQNQAACESTGGFWGGAGTSCDPNPCLGACCHQDGRCEFVTALACGTGEWRLNVPCDPNPCLGLGACCFADCHCEVTTVDQCLGVWMSGTLCSPNPCSCRMGACCFPNGSCQYLPESSCQSGDWRPNVPCSPNPCPQPSGACCFENGDCRILSRAECVAQGGSYVGDATECTPQLCAPVPVEQRTWGRIKSQYR